MKSMVRCISLLVVLGVATSPVLAAELRVTGFIDNAFPHWDSNTSAIDQDTTRNDDQIFLGRTRMRSFFNFIASDDLRGVFALEIDQTYGAPSANRLGSGCVEEEGPFAFEQCGFRNGIDTNSLELKHLYVDFRIPQLPIGNRWRVGGLPFNVTPLHSPLLYTMDAGGGDVRFTFSDQGKTVRIASVVSWVSFEVVMGVPRYRSGIEFLDADGVALQRFIESKRKLGR